VGRGSAHRGRFGGWEREGRGVQQVERTGVGELGHSHVDGLAVDEGASACRELGCVGHGLDGLGVLPGSEAGEAFGGRPGADEVRDVAVDAGLDGVLGFEQACLAASISPLGMGVRVRS
jgi:hypothetical protein